jgi:hypothetical protein
MNPNDLSTTNVSRAAFEAAIPMAHTHGNASVLNGITEPPPTPTDMTAINDRLVALETVVADVW